MDLDNSKEFKINPQLIINAVLIGVIAILGLFYFRNYFGSREKASIKSTEVKSQPNEFSSKKIVIDIEGAVQNPGIYELEEGKRVYDGVLLAGGFTEQADVLQISLNLNKAEKVKDGMKIIIPSKDQPNLLKETETASANSTEAQIININEASKELLEKLPKIGPTTADKIIQNRPYNEIKDLITKKVVGEATFEGIKELIDV